MFSNFLQNTLSRFGQSPSQDKLRVLERAAMDMNTSHPTASDLKAFGVAMTIRTFSPLVLAICAGQELSAVVKTRIRRKISGV